MLHAEEGVVVHPNERSRGRITQTVMILRELLKNKQQPFVTDEADWMRKIV